MYRDHFHLSAWSISGTNEQMLMTFILLLGGESNMGDQGMCTLKVEFSIDQYH